MPKLFASPILATTSALLTLLLVSAALAQSPTRVETVVVEESDLIDETPLTGSVSSSRITSLSAEVAGLVKGMHVDAGDRVAAGDLLLELDSQLGEIALEAAVAALRSARESLKDSRRQLQEAATLAEQENIPASEVRSLEAQAHIDEAAVQAAEAEVRRQQAELERHRIRAPFAGTVSRKSTEVGEWISPGSEILELVSTDELRLDFQVPQRFFPAITEQTRLTVRFDAYPQRSFTARAHRRVPLSDNEARTFLLRAVLEDAPPDLIPGMSADATLQLAAGARGLTVPRDALLRYPDGRVSVWVIGDRQADSELAQVQERHVRTGLDFADRVEIRSGLARGDEVITRGNEALSEGQSVMIVSSSE